MHLTAEETSMLNGELGRATQKSMEILTALGDIYGAERMVPVSSVQIAGVSYDNLGEAGLRFLSEMVAGGGTAAVLTTLNPAGMDIENWQALGISPDFAASRRQASLCSLSDLAPPTRAPCSGSRPTRRTFRAGEPVQRTVRWLLRRAGKRWVLRMAPRQEATLTRSALMRQLVW